jgi:hypothetical protein
VVIGLWAVEAFVFRLLLLLVLRKQLLCAFLSLIFLCGMMPFFVVGVFLTTQISSIYLILPATLGPGVFSLSNKNDYQNRKLMFLGSKMWRVRRADNLTVVKALCYKPEGRGFDT